MNPVSICAINRLITIYKEGTPATNIEVARITSDGDELQFNIIVQKGLYELGEKVLYIMPDYSIPDNESFVEYWRPMGDPKKSKLGKHGRIRAIKFNFQFEDSSDKIYSNGIIMPLQEVIKPEWIVNSEISSEIDLMTELGITKYVSEDSFDNQSTGLTKGSLPSFLYSTDETRCETLRKNINNVFEDGEELGITLKRDGSSATIYCRKSPIIDEWEIGVCTRNNEKKLVQEYTDAYKNILSGVILHQYMKKEIVDKKPINVYGWMDDVTQQFHTTEEVEDINKFTPITHIVRDAWVDTVNKFGYLDGLLSYCKKYDCELAIRGELIGSGNKGSGNKYNLDAISSESKIVWFGVDNLSNGFAERINYSNEHNLSKVCTELGFEYTVEILNVICNYDDLIKIGNDIFNSIKEKTGQIIEGIVIRTKFSNKLSCKYINPEYDSRN